MIAKTRFRLDLITLVGLLTRFLTRIVKGMGIFQETLWKRNN